MNSVSALGSTSGRYLVASNIRVSLKIGIFRCTVRSQLDWTWKKELIHCDHFRTFPGFDRLHVVIPEHSFHSYHQKFITTAPPTFGSTNLNLFLLAYS